MSDTMLYVVGVVGWVAVLLFVLVALRVATVERDDTITVVPEDLHQFRRGDIVQIGDEVFRVRSVHAPDKITVRRET